MSENLLLIYGVFFMVSLAFSLLMNRFLLKFSRNLGIRNTTETIIRWSSTSKPAMGGISFYIIFLFSVILIAFLIPDTYDFFNLQMLGFLIAVTLGFLAGLFDDAYNTRPWIKFFSQLLCGIILILTGTYIQIFESELLNYGMTIFWVVGMMNSVNMLDNMDGITTIVSIAVVTTILTMIFVKHDFTNPSIVMLIGVLSALVGFLSYNWHPSKMYMGDTGSQFLGIFLAGLGIMFFWNGLGFNGESTILMRFLSVAVVFLLPITDTTTVFYKRIARGQSPFVGGKDHTTHHLSYMGLSDTNIALVFAGISLVSFFLALLVTFFIVEWKPLHTIFLATYCLVVFTVLFIIANLNKSQSEKK